MLMEKDVDLGQTFCIRADVIGSRRTDKANELPEIAALLNKEFQVTVLTPFTVRAGDELFAVLKGESDGYLAFKTLYSFSREWDIPLYVGLGTGELESQQFKDAERVNGQAIWRASQALEELKMKPPSDILKRVGTYKFRFNIHVSEDKDLNLAVEHFLYLIMARVMKRTKHQALAVETKEKYPNWNNDRLFWHISKTNEAEMPSENASANFSKLMLRADYQLVREAETSFVYLLKQLNEKTR